MVGGIRTIVEQHTYDIVEHGVRALGVLWLSGALAEKGEPCTLR